MMTSRAASDVISPMPIFQLKPSGLMTGSMVRPMRAGQAVLDGGRLAAGVGQVRQHPEHHGHQQDHGAGALQEDLGAVQQAQAERLHGGPAVGRHLQQEGRLRALQHGGFQQPRRDHRGQESEQIEAQQRRHLRGDERSRAGCGPGMNAAINSA